MSIIVWDRVWVHSRIGTPIVDVKVQQAPSHRPFNREVAAKIADCYSNSVRYWVAHRVVASWQTPEFIGEQAYQCARKAAHYSRLAAD